MKKNKLILLTLLMSLFVNGQTVKKLNDPSIVAHHKRMTFESWGDWRPYPKYVLGIQTNFAYATVWGNWAPSRNRDYKRGEDIRPLKVDGLQNKRFAELKLEEEEAKKINESFDTIYKRNIQDFAHWTSTTVDADPLWLLYYKRILKPITQFPDEPNNYLQWELKDQETYETLKSTGTIKRFQEELDLIKEKYKMSRTMDMPRGKRFLMYHETLLKWRSFLGELRKHGKKTNLLISYKKLIKKDINHSKILGWSPSTDKQIVEKVMTKFKDKY